MGFISIEELHNVILNTDPETQRVSNDLLDRWVKVVRERNDPYSWDINEIATDIAVPADRTGWQYGLATVIAHNEDCQVYIGGERIVFIGIRYNPLKCADKFKKIVLELSEADLYYDKERQDLYGYGFVFGYHAFAPFNRNMIEYHVKIFDASVEADEPKKVEALKKGYVKGFRFAEYLSGDFEFENRLRNFLYPEQIKALN